MKAKLTTAQLLAELANHPEGFFSVSTKLLPKNARNAFAVRLHSSAGHYKAGDYCLCVPGEKTKSGDIVLHNDNGRLTVRQRKDTKDYIVFASLGRRSVLAPVIEVDDGNVLAKVERIFTMP